MLKFKKCNLLVISFLKYFFPVYEPIWFLKRRESLNSLTDNFRLKKVTLIFMLFLISLNFVSLLALIYISINLRYMFLSPLFGPEGVVVLVSVFMFFILITLMLYLILLLLQSFKVKNILKTYCLNNFEEDKIKLKFDNLSVAVLGIIYLQYKINKLRFRD